MGRARETPGDTAAGRRTRRRAFVWLSAATPWLVGLFYAMSGLDVADSVAAGWGVVGLAVVMGLVLARRAERPELVTAVVLALTVPILLLAPELVLPVGGFVAVWNLARRRPPAVSLVGLAGLLAVSALNLATTTVDDAVFTMGLSVSVWALGEAARNREAAISEASRRAAGEEQARIAREIHDVIAHTVSVIVVQAAAARDVFDTHPDQARTALASIEGAGREALAELRLLLRGVRADGGPGSGSPAVPPGLAAPQPGLHRMEELAAPLRAAGVRVVITDEGEPRSVPAGVDISAYRIVQEALTNTLRHARATVAEVTVRRRPDVLDIDVVDDGRPGPTLAAPGPGFGLVGMRERAASLGGSLEAGPTAHGGFRVHARLPLDAAR